MPAADNHDELLAYVRSERFLSLMTAQRMAFAEGATGMRGSCVLCQSDKFTMDTATETYRCEGCGSRGTAVDLLVALGAHPNAAAARNGIEALRQSGKSLVETIWPTVGPLIAEWQAEPQPWEKVDLTRLAEPLPSMVPGYLGQAEFAQLIAKSGHGKSTLAGYLCSCLIHGTPFLGVEPVVRPLQIGWLHFDSSMQRLGEMMARFPGVADHHGFAGFAGMRGDYLDSPDGPAMVDALIRRNGLRLLVIDALTSGIDGDENNTQEMKRLCYGLVGIAGATGCTILMLHHIGKSGDDSRGSTNITGAADRILKLKASKSKVMTLTVPKEREGATREPVKFRHELSEDGALRFALASSMPSPAEAKRAPVDRWTALRDYLVANGPVGRSKLVAGAGGNKEANAAEITSRLASGDLCWPKGEGHGKPVGITGIHGDASE